MLHPAIVKKEVPPKGEGLFATEKISAGEVVWHLDDEYCKLHPIDEEFLIRHPKAFQFGNHSVIVSDDSDFMNHSCDPNCWWKSDTELIARVDIAAGEEVTFDYASTDINPAFLYDFECLCGSPDCRKTISAFDFQNAAFQQKYRGHLPSWTIAAIEEYQAKLQQA